VSDSDVLQSLSVDELTREVRARVAQLEGLEVATDTTPETRLQDIDLAKIVEILQSQQKVIYGVDDRKDVFQINDQAILNDADSVVIVCDQNDVVDNGNGTSTLQTQNFGTSRNLCATEPFRDQPTTGFCSGFLVAPDIIATAGHCVTESAATTRRFVFGFRMLDATNARTVIDNTEIYRGVNIIGRQLVGNGADWALVRIDRPVTNHGVASIRRNGQIANDQAVHVIGHPVGLPTKVAGGAAVRDNSPPAFFVANLDTYGGNSGSPVFNSDTHEVEGILVRGETDFTTNGTCTVSFRCPNTGCRGEDCTRTTEFAQLIPLAPAGPG
jgi:Trypsin-like peptidase domain